MIRYTQVNFIYDIQKISNILHSYPMTDAQAISALDIFKISKLLPIKFPIVSILYFWLPPKFTGSIHRDIDLNLPHINPTFALNIPLSNCKRTSMSWYKETDNATIDIMRGITYAGRIPLLRRDQGIEIDSLIMTMPHFVSITDWHAVENHDESDSKFLSLRFPTHIKQEDVLID